VGVQDDRASAGLPPRLPGGLRGVLGHLLVLALAVAGPRRLAAVWRRLSGAVVGSDPVALAAVMVAPIGGVVTQWLPQVRRSGPAAVAAAIVIGVTNASAEEALWRALPVAMFPQDRVRGWLWPAVNFVVGHLVPLTSRPTTVTRAAGVLAGAALIGLGNGRVAQDHGSVAFVSVAHAVTDWTTVREGLISASSWSNADGRQRRGALGGNDAARVTEGGVPRRTRGLGGTASS
jgi:membrane protease YdiL (CAAX protease family)